MRKSEVYAALTEIFRELFGIEDIALTPNTTAEDIEGWDSFNHVNIVIATETRFGVRLHAREIEELKSVGDLVKIIMDKTVIKKV